LTYRVKLVSQTNAIVFIIIGLVSVLVSAGTLLPKGGLQNKGLSIVLVSLLGFTAYVLWQLLVTGRTIWTIDENKIKIVWTKKFILSHSEDETIKWSEIKDIRRGSDPQYYNLKIELTSGYTIKYFHDTLTTRDDFEEMLKALYQTLKDKNAAANIALVKARADRKVTSN
jgi:hypothetical protein